MERDKSVRISPSSPDFEEINLLQTMIHVVKNPHVYHNYDPNDLPEAERKAIEQTLKDRQQELLDFQRLPFNSGLVRARRKPST